MKRAMTALWLLAIQGIFGKDGGIMMAMFFAQRVILGKCTFAQVAEVLLDSGLAELVPVEYGGTEAME